MIRVFFCIFLIIHLALPVTALEISAPAVPPSGAPIMPSQTDSFGKGLIDLLKNALLHIRPDLADAYRICTQIIAAAVLLSVLQTLPASSKRLSDAAGAAAVTGILFLNTNSMIQLCIQTIRELSDYGKLLWPVMTSAMATQGGVSASAALYVGTSIFDTMICELIARIFIPMVYLFLAFSVGNCALGDDILRKIGLLIRNLVAWCLKTSCIVFTTYMSITGAITGSTDVAALKAAKVTISSFVPVVGSILSDASESVLISAGLLKNAAGIYGILASLAIFLEPFLKTGIHYLLLKAVCAICSIFAPKSITGLIDDFSAAFGLLLGMTGAVCLLLLVSTVCFMKGVG